MSDTDIREALELVASEDFRVNGCACTVTVRCYFHEHVWPGVATALARLEAERDELADEGVVILEKLQGAEDRAARSERRADDWAELAGKDIVVALGRAEAAEGERDEALTALESGENPSTLSNLFDTRHRLELAERENVELRREMEPLIHEAAKACTEPRRFHENEDSRQQSLSQAVARARAALSRDPAATNTVTLTRGEIGLAIDGVAKLVQPHEESEYRPLLRKLQAAYRLPVPGGVQTPEETP